MLVSVALHVAPPSCRKSKKDMSNFKTSIESGCAEPGALQETKAKELHYELVPFLCNNTTLFVKVRSTACLSC